MINVKDEHAENGLLISFRIVSQDLIERFQKYEKLHHAEGMELNITATRSDTARRLLQIGLDLEEKRLGDIK